MGGNKVSQLLDRWDGDAISLKPNVLTIVIGINDYFYFEKNNIPVKKYYDDYRKLVETTLEKFPDLILIIGEPFCIDSPNVERNFLLEFQSASKRISDEFHANFIPLQTIFNRAIDFAPRSYWSREGDGIHPSIAGAYLLGTAWLNLFEL
ncbi:GDSL-type esterase/lipase family protein [Sunxiuqinia elliptica]|uniref:GDSL-type esterase/lipase family protein n=1 Tax=Sunxiuqinia elliptica TaxID=655355 RepID=UPI0021CEF6E6|nr:GDSL-type esterase/lipase family protein [Sunxiuqinia elliptica]